MRAAKNSKWRSRTCQDSSCAMPSAPIQPKCSAAANRLAVSPSPVRHRLYMERGAPGPLRVRVEREHRARQALEGEALEHRRGQARGVDLDHALGREEFVEAAAEVAARL